MDLMRILYYRWLIKEINRSVRFYKLELTLTLDDYIRNNDRPQSAMSQSTRPGSAIAKMTEASMRGTFYSTATGEGANPQGETRIVESFKLSNILELSD